MRQKNLNQGNKSSRGKWLKRQALLLVLLLLPLGILAAYKVTTIEMVVNIDEVLEVIPSQVTLDVDPNETVQQVFIIRNTGRGDLLNVNLSNRIIPGTLTLNLTEFVDVPALSEVTLTAEITAPQDIPPGQHTIQVEVHR